jgi:phage terminase large subunit-like protein
VSRRIDDSLLPKKESTDSPNKIDAIDALIQAIGGYLRATAPLPQYAITVVG